MSGLLADLVVVVHLAFVVFAVLGALLVWRRSWVAWLHLPALAWAAWVEITGGTCPLTPLENDLRRAAGGEGYGTSFVEHHLLPVLYPPGLTREHQWLLAAALLLVNGVLYGRVIARWRARSRAPDVKDVAMPDARTVAGHYAHGDLLGAIRRGVESLGKTVGDVDVDDLAPVDEFHIGGRAATDAFLDPLGIAADEHWLDVGCGLGGAARLAARRFGCRVTGIDLTPDYVATGTALCEWVGLQERVTLSVEDGRSLPHADGAFDGAYLLHVGMNVPDKPALFAELHRVVRPGGRLAVYDVMRTGAGELAFPLPWAADAEGSAVSSPDEYRRALEAAGWRVAAERDRRDFAVEFFARMQARASEGQGPPPLGIHILMGETAPLKVANMIANIERGVIAPVELVAEKSGENSAEEPAGEAR